VNLMSALTVSYQAMDDGPDRIGGNVLDDLRQFLIFQA